MKIFIDSISGECKRYLHRTSMTAWLFILILILFQTHYSVNDINSISEKTKTFKQNQKICINIMNNYIAYKAMGFKILFIPSTTGLTIKSSTNPSDLSSTVLYNHIKINNNWKGKVVFRQGRFLELDIFGIIKWLMSLMALWFGFVSFSKKEFLDFLSSKWSRGKCYFYTALARLLLFITFFLVMMGIVILFMILRGVHFSAGDWHAAIAFLLEAIAFLGIFFGVGVIIGILGARKLSYILLFIAWFGIIFAVDWVIAPAVEPNFPEALEDYRVEKEKISDMIDFDKNAEKEHGKFDRKNIEAARGVIEDYWKNYYLKIIVPKERELRDMIAGGIEKDRSWSKWFPGAFFTQTSDEVSGSGYNNYLLFYDYSLEKHIQFVRFIIDRTYYNDPKIMVNFIKGDEDIFIGKSSLPPNFWGGLAIQYGYLVLILLAGYLIFMRKMLPKPENAGDFDNIEIKFNSGENSDIKDNTNRDEFGEQVLNVFLGKCRDLKWKVTMDGKSLLTGKKHPFIFIPKPNQIPDEWKIKHLLKFFKRLFNLDDKDLQSLYNEKPGKTRKKWLNKFYRELDIEEKAALLISLFMLTKMQVYVCNTFAYDIPGEIRLKMYSLVEEKQPEGSMIIDINRMDSKWMYSKIWQRYYYKNGEYYSLPALINS
jgi:hypothetical protein